MENCRSLDVNRLSKEGCLRPGYRGGWAWTVDGEQVASIGLRATADQLILKLPDVPQRRGLDDVEEAVPLPGRPAGSAGSPTCCRATSISFNSRLLSSPATAVPSRPRMMRRHVRRPLILSSRLRDESATSVRGEGYPANRVTSGTLASILSPLPGFARPACALEARPTHLSPRRVLERPTGCRQDRSLRAGDLQRKLASSARSCRGDLVVILAVALQPVHAWLAARLGGSRRLAAVILTLVLLAIIVKGAQGARMANGWTDRSRLSHIS